jgi:hypothetical protein
MGWPSSRITFIPRLAKVRQLVQKSQWDIHTRIESMMISKAILRYERKRE